MSDNRQQVHFHINEETLHRKKCDVKAALLWHPVKKAQNISDSEPYTGVSRMAYNHRF